MIAANYGRRLNSPLCSAENETNVDTAVYTGNCRAPDVLTKLQKLCDYRDTCKIMVDDKNFFHGCSSGEPLEMFIVYQCNFTKRK